MNNKLPVIRMYKNLHNAFNVYSVYRYIAYRRSVLWICHQLGKGNRKVLPACVVSRIRQAFPSETCTGFQYPRPDSKSCANLVQLVVISSCLLTAT